MVMALMSATLKKDEKRTHLRKQDAHTLELRHLYDFLKSTVVIFAVQSLSSVAFQK